MTIDHKLFDIIDESELYDGDIDGGRSISNIFDVVSFRILFSKYVVKVYEYKPLDNDLHYVRYDLKSER